MNLINHFISGTYRSAVVKLPQWKAQMPKILSTDPWDGKDGELPQEEDIDLSDVDLEKDEL